MKAEETRYRILHWAFVEIRYQATQSQNDKIFALAHSLHNFPLYLLDVKTDDDDLAPFAKRETTPKDDDAWTSLSNHIKESLRPHDSDEVRELADFVQHRRGSAHIRTKCSIKD